MKRNILILLFTLIGLVLLSGCEDSGDPIVPDDDTTQQVLDRLEKNDGISYTLFDILGERLTADSLELLRQKADSKSAFINTVARQSDGYFAEVVNAGMADFNITTVPTPFHGEAEITLKSLVSSPDAAGAAPFDLVGEYSKKLLSLIKEQASGKKEWVLIESVPSEAISFNFTKVEVMAAIPHTIMMNLDLTDDQVLTSISDVLKANDIPPVAIALLLPAVQKFNDANATNDQPFNDAMNAWLEGPVTQAINGGLDRDIIRRIQAVVYLAALHTVILDEYNGTSVDVASLSVLHARYRAAIIMGASELWVE